MRLLKRKYLRPIQNLFLLISKFKVIECNRQERLIDKKSIALGWLPALIWKGLKHTTHLNILESGTGNSPCVEWLSRGKYSLNKKYYKGFRKPAV